MSFDWQTDERVDWDEPPVTTPEPGQEPSGPGRRGRWLLLALLILVVGAALGSYWALTQRVEEATEDAESDLMASYTVIEDAASEGDAELLTTFLSGRDNEWAVTLEQLVLDGHYQNREAFGLTHLPADPATTVLSTTLNAAFNSAEVVAEQVYSYSVGNGITETVRLRQTAVYRLGPDRWLLAPPTADFWGETQSKAGFFLTFTYPARDQKIVERLALDLDTTLAALCASTAFDCPRGFHLQVEFSTNPAALSPQFDTVVFVNDSWLVRLPTPTLAGLPPDEAGYQVMVRGYSAQLVSPLMRQLSGLIIGSEGPFWQAWEAWQLRRLALRPYPLTLTNWQHLAEQAVTLRAGEPLWRSREPATPFVYALLDFLIQDLRVAPKTMGHSLAGSEVMLYDEWLQAMTDNRFTMDELETRWRAYVQTKQAQRWALATAAVPPQPLVLLCQDEAAGALALYRHDFARNQTTKLADLPADTGYIRALPNHSGLAVTLITQGEAGQVADTFLWADGAQFDLAWPEAASVAFPSLSDPTRQQLLWTMTAPDDGYWLLNIPTCLAGEGCAPTPMEGYPAWSPNGVGTITAVGETRLHNEGLDGAPLLVVYESDKGPDLGEITAGISPFWFDNEWLGYVVSGPDEMQIVEANVSNLTPSVVLSSTRLLASLPEAPRAGTLRLEFVRPSPQNPKVLLILGVGDGGPLLFAAHGQAGEIIAQPLALQPHAARGYRFSPDGRWLLIAGLEDEAGQQWRIYLYHVTTGALQTFTAHAGSHLALPMHWHADWTDDGRWLALVEDNFIRLMAPAQDYEQSFAPAGLHCASAAWGAGP